MGLVLCRENRLKRVEKIWVKRARVANDNTVLKYEHKQLYYAS